MDYEEFFPNRLTQLRLDAGVSARDMSISIGQSQGYINRIESRQNFPSMSGFFYICEYLHITPAEFFDSSVPDPRRAGAIAEKLKSLTGKQLEAIEHIVDVMVETNAQT